MKFNLTLLESIVFLFIWLAIYIWTKHGRQIRRWLQDYFRRRRGPRTLKPKAPSDCPECCQEFSRLPLRPKPELIPWTERKSPRGRPKTIGSNGYACLNPLCDYFAIADAEIHALVSNGYRGHQQIRYWKCQACGGCRTSRYGTPLYWLKTPLARITLVMIIPSAPVKRAIES